MLKITLEEGEFHEVSRRLIDELANPRKIYAKWSGKVRERAQKNALSHSKGGDFWPSIAAAVFTSVSDKGAEIFCTHVAGRIKHEGGTVSAPGRGPGAKGAQALTIPIHEAAKGKSAGELRGEGYDIFRPKGTNILATEKDGELIPLYALVKSVKLPPEPWWPDDTFVMETGRKEVERTLRKINE